jgi:hypothetical protein
MQVDFEKIVVCYNAVPGAQRAIPMCGKVCCTWQRALSLHRLSVNPLALVMERGRSATFSPSLNNTIVVLRSGNVAAVRRVP